MVRDLDSSSLVQSIVIQIQIGPLVEAVVDWFGGGRPKVRMDIREAVHVLVCRDATYTISDISSHRVKRGTSPGWRGIMMGMMGMMVMAGGYEFGSRKH